MLKRLLIASGFAALMVTCMSGQQDVGGDKNGLPRKGQPPTVVANSQNDYCNALDAPANPAGEPFQWHIAVKQADWWLFFAAMATLLVIIWQTIQTRRAAEATRDAAKAALLQANHTVTSERAWMIAEPGDAGIPPEIEGSTGIRWTDFSVRFVNKGKTPAFLLEVGYCGTVLPQGEALPGIPPPYKDKEISKWGGKGLPLLPGADFRKNHLGTWASDPVKIKRGFDVLWVYGYIKYGDAFGSIQETRYCYRWVHEIERYQASGFIAGGPESYNHAT
jgi:hypothetical protein